MNKWIDIDNKRRLKPGEIYRERTNIKAQHYMILKGPKGFSTTEETKETKETKERGLIVPGFFFLYILLFH